MVETEKDSEVVKGEGWGWTRGQRVGLGILLGVLILFLVVQWWRRPRVDDPVVVVNGERVRLPGRIDPNTATVAEMMVIPHVSAKIAAGIVEYREARKSQALDGVVFREPEDLLHVAGVTKAVLGQVRGYLEFPEDTADTQPMP